MKIVDAKGLTCPQPLILTRKTLAEKSGDFRIVLDDTIAKNNIERFLKHENQKFVITENEEEIFIDVTEVPDENVIEVEKMDTGAKPVYVFKTEGVGSDELGKMLTAGFLATIKEVIPLPVAIVFYHEGVKLVLDDSDYLQSFEELQKLGIKLIICGNCVKFYDVVDRVALGDISNAYDILTIMSNAHHIVYP